MDCTTIRNCEQPGFLCYGGRNSTHVVLCEDPLSLDIRCANESAIPHDKTIGGFILPRNEKCYLATAAVNHLQLSQNKGSLSGLPWDEDGDNVESLHVTTLIVLLIMLIVKFSL